MGVRGRNAYIDIRQRLIQPPGGLDAAAGKHWQAIVTGLDASHFAQSDAAMLGTYCKALALADRAHCAIAAKGALTADGRASPWHGILAQQVKAISMLGIRLRLCPQGRLDPKTAHTLGREDQARKRPWEIDADDS